MQKKEIIWRYILEESFKKRPITFTQKEIAERYHLSTSTVFNALKIPRQLGIIDITGRYFRLRDAEKLLMVWATHRNLKKDVLYTTNVPMAPREIEGMMPPDVVFGAYSAYRLKYDDAPADYSQVYVYTKNLEEIQKRFPPHKGTPNLYVLNSDPHLDEFGGLTPNSQTFVDLWNVSEWYAKDYLKALREKMEL